ncbi:MAG: hypothetical protein ACK56C_09080 [Alphaproteobacteria bacterium]|jgi:RES domain-containing protein
MRHPRIIAFDCSILRDLAARRSDVATVDLTAPDAMTTLGVDTLTVSRPDWTA